VKRCRFRAYLKLVLCRIRVHILLQRFLHIIPEHTTVPILGKELWRQQDEQLLQRYLGLVIRERLEVYVDDMIVKSKQVDEHLANLLELLMQLRKYNMRLNPRKCTFGVQVGKFLGYMLTERGIKVNPDKCKATLEMRSPKMLKKIQ